MEWDCGREGSQRDFPDDGILPVQSDWQLRGREPGNKRRGVKCRRRQGEEEVETGHEVLRNHLGEEQEEGEAGEVQQRADGRTDADVLRVLLRVARLLQEQDSHNRSQLQQQSDQSVLPQTAHLRQDGRVHDCGVQAGCGAHKPGREDQEFVVVLVRDIW